MTDATTPRKVKQLAKKNRWIAGLLTLFITPAGYLYTGRKKLALITLVIWLPLIMAPEDNDTLSTLLGFLIIGATVENVIAINRAKAIAKELGVDVEQAEEISDLRIELLKLVQQKGPVTMADCVIQTGQDVDEIRAVLVKLESQDLVRSGNRDSDGAVVYTIV
ncbi:hypothetical protein [Halomicronema sp. CCY15110]|uniref:hypothetical protein n=1 Tax=Halomicronema sp. CCY15110 TaxID=2767773 RepID=UPI001951DBED|nr:hypothetical protein [Halomicronema sp. CCY15110]